MLREVSLEGVRAFLPGRCPQVVVFLVLTCGKSPQVVVFLALTCGKSPQVVAFLVLTCGKSPQVVAFGEGGDVERGWRS